MIQAAPALPSALAPLPNSRRDLADLRAPSYRGGKPLADPPKPPDGVPAGRMARLEAENERLRDRLAFFEEQIFGGCLQVPGAWGLTARQHRLLGLLLARTIVSPDAALTALYGYAVDDEPPSARNNVETAISRMRRKLAPHAIIIRSRRYLGYWIDEPRRGELNRALRLMGPPWQRPDVNKSLTAPKTEVAEGGRA